MKKIGMICFLIIFNNVVFSMPSVNQLINSIDEMETLQNDMTVKIKLTQQKPGQGIKIMEAVYYRRDSDDSFLIYMIGPDSEKGNGYLRTGENMFMYRRNTRTFQHIPRDERVGGSDVSTGDMEQRKFSELYKPSVDANGKEIITEETLGNAKIPVYRFHVEARVEDVKYNKLVLWVTTETNLILKQDSYSSSDTLMETSYSTQYTKIGDHYIPLRKIFIDKFEEGNKTIVELSGISLKNLSDNIFTKAYLENLSK